MSPEQLPKSHLLVLNSPLRDVSIKVDDKSDMWAFGLVLCEMFVRVPPWSERGAFDELRRDKRSWIPPEARRFISDKTQDAVARTVVKQCLCFDKDNRPNASQVQLKLLEAGWSGAKRSSSASVSSKLLPEPTLSGAPATKLN